MIQTLSSIPGDRSLLERLAFAEPIAWLNPNNTDSLSGLSKCSLTKADVDEAEERLFRFAPFIAKAFPDTKEQGGIIESPLREIPAMKSVLNEQFGASIFGTLFLKMDSHLAAAGSVKARGGIYEVLKHAEELALAKKKIDTTTNYEVFANDEMRTFFSGYSIHVGSTGNLGLSVGIAGAALGFRTYVYMSVDAKKWKRELLKSRGVNVVSCDGDYGEAVARGRRLTEQDPTAYFIDDENSKDLFLGYAVAARRLEKQLLDQGYRICADRPLFVYIPCGVGGAPGGITFGLKQVFGDHVHIFFAEPVQACCMLLGLITGMHNRICVQDIGLSGITEADGLAVSRPSGFVGKTIEPLLAGEVTVKDEQLYAYMKTLCDSENIFIEPSACAAFEGAVKVSADPAFSEWAKAQAPKGYNRILHIVWATGGSFVPKDVRLAYTEHAEKI